MPDEPGPRMLIMLGRDSRVDLLISDRVGEPVAAVELKNRRDLRRDIAVQLRRNLAAHGALGNAAYFLLLSQDTGYLWKDAGAHDWLAPPSWEFPMQAAVARYAGPARSPDRLRESEFAALVFRWLQALTQSIDGAREEPERSLEEAGLLEAMRGGAVADQVAV
jgi:hypothetical protein